MFNAPQPFCDGTAHTIGASVGWAPTALNAQYYAQRASAGLIITEASQISPKGLGYANTPGIYNHAQVAGWRMVTEAVHAKGGRIFIQLWHVGRHSHPLLQQDGSLPFAPSAVPENVPITTPAGKIQAVVPHAMSETEIAETVADYRNAAVLAMEAGFDGVEIHAANGYLIDQFLNDSSNLRSDSYGGSIAAKCRFALEATDAIVLAIGTCHTGIRLSPSGTNFGVRNRQPIETFEYMVNELNHFGLAYVHLIEPDTARLEGLPKYLRRVTPHFRPLVNTTLITSAGYDFDLSEAALKDGLADLVAFGKRFISNPDLVERYRKGASFNAWDETTFYGGGARGYTDYPFYSS